MLKKNFIMPSNIYLWWNFGSIISIFFFLQILMGFFLSMNYLNKNNQFFSSMYIYYNINFGWFFRYFHNIMTSLIFILLILHIKRNLFFSSFLNKFSWLSGMIMFLLMMMISFLGYTLTWTQMSYWGMMVITNFISIIPYFGNILMMWLWGNFNINIILINRFFSMHFILPFFIIIFIFIHLNFIHMNKSLNPLGLNNNIDLYNLIPNSLIKDMILLILFIFILMNFIYLNPLIFNNYDNFIFMNYFITPNHIEPEWYFLFFFSILRSIENKLSGMIYMIISLMLLIFFPIFIKMKIQSTKFNFLLKFFFMNFFMIFIFISIFGALNIEEPYIFMNKILINFYMLSYFFMFFLS